MYEAKNEFLKGLKYEEDENSQRQIAEEAIRKQFFYMLNELNLENGDAVSLNQMCEQIGNNLGLETSKIAQFIRQVFQQREYQYYIDDKGNVVANYDRLYILQQQDAEQLRKEANLEK